MRVLVVTHELPGVSGFGGAMRTFHLVRQLAHRHEVRLLVVAQEDPGDALESVRPFVQDIALLQDPRRLAPYHPSSANSTWPTSGPRLWLNYGRAVVRMLIVQPERIEEVQRLRPLVRQHLEDIWRRWPFDVVQAEHSLNGGLLDGLPSSVRKVVSFIDLHWVLRQRQYDLSRRLRQKVWGWFEWNKYLRYERRIATKADLCITMSAPDAMRLRAAAPGANVAVLPNGVDGSHFSPVAVLEPEWPVVAFSGTMNYFPNDDAMRYYAADIHPRIRAQRPDSRLIVVGRNPSPAVQALDGKDGISVTGAVPDTRSYLQQAAVVVAPLRMGSGTRLKILEALAMGKAVVSTGIGAEGLEVTPGKDIIIADAPDEFAQAVTQLLADPQRRARLGQAGRALVEARYEWDAIGRRQNELYASLAGVTAPVGR